MTCGPFPPILILAINQRDQVALRKGAFGQLILTTSETIVLWFTDFMMGTDDEIAHLQKRAEWSSSLTAGSFGRMLRAFASTVRL